MKITEAVKLLKHYQGWRLGDDIEMLEPKQVTEVIDTILMLYEERYKMTDSIVEKVIKKYKERSELRQNKYGTTLDRKDLTLLDWINHAQEEAMDLSLYLEKLKQKLFFEGINVD